MTDLIATARDRQRLWENGYRPVGLLSASDPDPKRAGKSPVGRRWIEDALCNPPRAAVERAMAHLANTGILTGHSGAVAVDVDVDAPEPAEAIEGLLVQHLGAGLTRRRSNSARFAVVFGSDDDDPPRGRVLKGEGGRIEVLSDRHQLAAYGTHVSGVPLLWPLAGPGDVPLWLLPRISAAQVHALFVVCAPVLGAVVPAVRAPRHSVGAEGVAPDLAMLASALAAIPTDGMGYGDWIRIGGSLHAATGGSDDGLALWDAWSARSPHYRPAGLAARWHGLGRGISARTVFHLARRFGWRPPQAEPPPAWLTAHPPLGGAAWRI